MGIEVSGILGLLVLILDVWAIINILGTQATPGSKLLWIVLILILPLLGVVLWYLLGPRAKSM